MAEAVARYFEDFPVGFAFATEPYTLTLEAIREFAASYDPQPFHLDAEAAAGSVFRRLVASGWQTACITMRLLVDSGMFDATGLVGLGADQIRWSKPVFPGDTLRVQTEVLERTPSRSGRRGTVRWQVTAVNQHGESVMSMQTLTLFPARPR